MAEAAAQKKRVMLYFGQDGCPYCKQLLEVNFRQRETVERMQKGVVALALNIWGDREVVWTDGKARTEKALAAHLKVQYTPTLVFLDEKGGIALRVNGYWPPRRLDAALDYVAGRISAEALQKSMHAPQASAALNPQPFIREDKTPGRPYLILFETPHCSACDELHREVFTRPEVLKEIGKFNVLRFPVPGPEARARKVDYVPTAILFEPGGREVLRLEAYFRPFHMAGSLEYVSSGAWRKEPSFQRFLQAKSDRMKKRGERVELWK